MKMYILIREAVPVGNAMVACGHASLACYLKYKDHPNMDAWLNPGPFYKVVCKVTDAEFELAKEEPDHVVLTESTLGGQEVAIAFVPREEFPKRFKFFRKYQ